MVVIAVRGREKRSHLLGKRKVWTYLLSFYSAKFVVRRKSLSDCVNYLLKSRKVRNSLWKIDNKFNGEQT
jgi:hypothetical protein